MFFFFQKCMSSSGSVIVQIKNFPFILHICDFSFLSSEGNANSLGLRRCGHILQATPVMKFYYD